MTRRITLDPIACSGHGLCADLLPELIELDEWGFPILHQDDVPEHLIRHARRAVSACPALALRLRSPALRSPALRSPALRRAG